MSESLQRLYDKIPTFKCRPGCGDCCGLVPWSPDEWAKVADRLPADATTMPFGATMVIPFRTGSVKCPFFDAGCTVYEDRPFMCRLFGTARDARLTCPHGCQPKHILTMEKAYALKTRYQSTARE